VEGCHVRATMTSVIVHRLLQPGVPVPAAPAGSTAGKKAVPEESQQKRDGMSSAVGLFPPLISAFLIAAGASRTVRVGERSGHDERMSHGRCHQLAGFCVAWKNHNGIISMWQAGRARTTVSSCTTTRRAGTHPLGQSGSSVEGQIAIARSALGSHLFTSSLLPPLVRCAARRLTCPRAARRLRRCTLLRVASGPAAVPAAPAARRGHEGTPCSPRLRRGPAQGARREGVWGVGRTNNTKRRDME